MRNVFEEMDYKPTPENVFQGPYKDIRLADRRVVCAACKLDNLILAGARHFDTVMARQIEHLGAGIRDVGMAEQGFIDQFGIFMTRAEAFALAKKKGQIKDKPCVDGTLFSEDLY